MSRGVRPEYLSAARAQRDHGKLDVARQGGAQACEGGGGARREGGMGYRRRARSAARGTRRSGGSAGFFFIHRLPARLNTSTCLRKRRGRRDLRPNRIGP